MFAPIDVRIVGTLPTDWPAVLITAGAGVLGAIVGGLISYAIARKGASETRSAILAARREAEEAATVRTTTKLMELTDAAGGYHAAIERQIEEYKANNGGREPEPEAQWLHILPQIGKPKEINITADDLVILTRSRNFDLLTKLFQLFSLYNSMIYGVEGYSTRREALMEQIIPDQLEGLHGQVALTEAELRPLLPRIASVSNLAVQIRAEAKNVYGLALESVRAFGPAARAYFADPKFPIPGIIAEAGTKAKQASEQ